MVIVLWFNVWWKILFTRNKWLWLHQRESYTDDICHKQTADCCFSSVINQKCTLLNIYQLKQIFFCFKTKTNIRPKLLHRHKITVRHYSRLYLQLICENRPNALWLQFIYPIQCVIGYFSCLVSFLLITHTSPPRGNTAVRFKMAPGRLKKWSSASFQLLPLGGEQIQAPQLHCDRPVSLRDVQGH